MNCEILGQQADASKFMKCGVTASSQRQSDSSILKMRATILAAAVAGAVAAGNATLRGSASSGALRVGGSCTGTAYDFFLLVEQWPISQCDDVFSCTTTLQYFTMHGLWPNLNSGDYPCTCTNQQFDPAAVASIQSELNSYWPSLNGPQATFLAHEYEKHGTCAEDVLPTELDFFSTALKLRSAFDTGQALKAAGYAPSNTQGFSLAEFKSATTAANGFAAAVSCDSSGRILETQVCISKGLQPIACPASVTDACTASTLYLPATQQ